MPVWRATSLQQRSRGTDWTKQIHYYSNRKLARPNFLHPVIECPKIINLLLQFSAKSFRNCDDVRRKWVQNKEITFLQIMGCLICFCHFKLGMTSLEIGSHLAEKNLDHPHFWPIYKAAEELDMLIFVHPWDMDSWSGRTSKYWMPWLVGRLIL